MPHDSTPERVGLIIVAKRVQAADLKPTTKLVAMMIGDTLGLRNGRQQGWPGAAKLALWCNLSERTVRSAFKELRWFDPPLFHFRGRPRRSYLFELTEDAISQHRWGALIHEMRDKARAQAAARQRRRKESKDATHKSS